MTEWRDIPMRVINFHSMRSHLGRSARTLHRLTNGYDEKDAPKPYGKAAWRELTLGQVADLGRRELMRHQDFGEKTLAALQYVIDMAADGKLHLTTGPAADALRPTNEATP